MSVLDGLNLERLKQAGLISLVDKVIDSSGGSLGARPQYDARERDAYRDEGGLYADNQRERSPHRDIDNRAPDQYRISERHDYIPGSSGSRDRQVLVSNLSRIPKRGPEPKEVVTIDEDEEVPAFFRPSQPKYVPREKSKQAPPPPKPKPTPPKQQRVFPGPSFARGADFRTQGARPQPRQVPRDEVEIVDEMEMSPFQNRNTGRYGPLPSRSEPKEPLHSSGSFSSFQANKPNINVIDLLREDTGNVDLQAECELCGLNLRDFDQLKDHLETEQHKVLI